MITKSGWVDKPIPESIKNIFMAFGEKVDYEANIDILSENQRSDSFYYVTKGLLSVILYENYDTKGIVVKFIPKGRVFGFAEFLCGKRRRYLLSSVRQSSVYKIKYETMEYLTQTSVLSKRLLKFYGKRALETKHTTQAVTCSLNDLNLPQVVTAGLSGIKDWDEYGRYKKVVELTPKELCGLKYVNRNRNRFRRGKEKAVCFEA